MEAIHCKRGLSRARYTLTKTYLHTLKNFPIPPLFLLAQVDFQGTGERRSNTVLRAN